MDAELFRKVMPSQCLGSTWGKRNKPGNEHLAPTVQATVDHFRRVVSLVVTTCLGDPSMTAQDRARVVEHWIQVAQVCCGRPSGAPLWSLGNRLCTFISSQDCSVWSKPLHSP
ncbi:ral-GDS-related protein-like [Diceros bicornis minor]|uniref:ral-GDS-related protein-like n=1 Tax=Diceros bicornis minor TaxID=77932 RepID=UPI0026EED04F|nr:ral-GDS-related protein-like [Diceros bicornis minor]